MVATKERKPMPENALAKKAMDEIGRIEREAQDKKLAQLDSLQTAKAHLLDRMRDIQREVDQIDEAISHITGKAMSKERRERRDLSGERERVARWMAGRQGQQFSASDLVREFPELDGTPISIFLKPLVESGRIKTDASGGIRRTKYFVAG
jgi:hypothetical protein